MTPLSVAVAAVVTVVIAAVSSPALVHGLGSGSTLAVSYGSGAVCGVVAGERYQRIECYRGGETISIEPNISSFSSISGGRDFFCGLRSGGFALFCWNTSFVAKRIYFNYTVLLENLAVGDDQVCATVNGTGVVKCWRGENSSSLSESSQFSSISSGQLNVPSGSAYEFSNLSLGENHSCAIRQSNGSVVCWGGGGEFSTNATNGISFESIVSGLNFTCGLITTNYSIICWGPGWPSSSVSGLGLSPLPLSIILPGPCVQSSSCECVYPGSQYLCYGSEVVCKPCRVLVPGSPVPLSPVSPPSVSPPSSPSRALSRGLLAFAIVGSVGAFSGICTIIYACGLEFVVGTRKSTTLCSQQLLEAILMVVQTQ
ncbi:putative serine/threonine-protein kinase-like protein CCR3 [Vitis vinifera]|uniref:non-specific serine/threonine protein kinase n=1 Tax=Vitis vinifera TaxID=29760 RepID=A0A438J277_VITVI|nr:putative serine/threonine-protein kinase-like protein CCR3 [Vitis vinifera]